MDGRFKQCPDCLLGARRFLSGKYSLDPSNDHGVGLRSLEAVEVHHVPPSSNTDSAYAHDSGSDAGVVSLEGLSKLVLRAYSRTHREQVGCHLLNHLPSRSAGAGRLEGTEDLCLRPNRERPQRLDETGGIVFRARCIEGGPLQLRHSLAVALQPPRCAGVALPKRQYGVEDRKAEMPIAVGFEEAVNATCLRDEVAQGLGQRRHGWLALLSCSALLSIGLHEFPGTECCPVTVAVISAWRCSARSSICCAAARSEAST